MAVTDQLHDFSRDLFGHSGTTRTVFRRGDGPGVVIIHELPGITPKVADFARHVSEAGFRVTLPVLAGRPGADPTKPEILRSVAKVCVSKEISLLASGASSPIVSWLRALANYEHETCGGAGVGVVGMCFSGGFALAMAVERSVLAPVMSQPSLPIKLPIKLQIKRGGRTYTPHSIDVSDADLATIKQRFDTLSSSTANACVLALRFSGDRLVPAERFAFLKERLGDRFVGITIEGDGHSVLTEQLVESERARVIDLFRETLR